MEILQKTLSDRLRFAMQVLNTSQTELAKKIKVKPQIIQYLCAGKSEKSKFTFDIAEALNIDVTWLATGRGCAPTKSESAINKRTIPLLTYGQIKNFKMRQKFIVSNEITSWISINDDISINSFAVTLNDKAMAPRFDLNTIIIVDPIIDLRKLNNAMVLVYLNDEDFCIFREMKVTDEAKILIPKNNLLYKDILLKETDIILGICKEARWNI